MQNISLTPPSSIEAEESVLGSIFLDPLILPEIIEEIRWEDFYYDKNKTIFRYSRHRIFLIFSITLSLNDLIISIAGFLPHRKIFFFIKAHSLF